MSGSWSVNKERLTANEIRKQAWQRVNYKLVIFQP